MKWTMWAAAAALAVTAGGATAQETINIGYTGPLSGGAALYGKNCLSGLELAAKEIADAGGFEIAGKKYKFNIVSLDDKYSPSEAAVNAKRLRSQYQAPVVFTPHSGGVFAIQAFNEQDGFILGAYTSAPAATERGNKLSLRIPPSFAGYVEPFLRTEMAAFGKKLGMAAADHDYAKAWAGLFGPAWKAAGGEVVAENPMSYNKDTDFYSGVARVLAAKPDVMFIGGASEPTALVAKQARELGFKGGFIVLDQAKLDEMAKVVGGLDLLEGSIGTMPLVYDTRPRIVSFVKKVRSAMNRDPGSEMSYHYSTLWALASAMSEARSATDAKGIFAKLGPAFAGLPDDRNPSYINGIDEKGGSSANILVAFVKGGKIQPIEVKSGTGDKS